MNLRVGQLLAGPRTRTGDVVAAAQMACLLEAAAPKPGNVSPGRPFRDSRYEDFVASAVAIGVPLLGAGVHPLGHTIRTALEATRRWTSANTNLGLVLLLAPLVRAALLHEDRGQLMSPERLRGSLARVLESATVADAADVYDAIRASPPGGLGRVDAQDVSAAPTVTLFEAMRLAAHRDTIAREYCTAFDITFTLGAPVLTQARRQALDWNDAIVQTFLQLLAAHPDTHIVRRAGEQVARDVSINASAVLDAGGVGTEEGRRAIDAFDVSLRDPLNQRNPGTTADLTAASIMVVLLDEGWAPSERVHG